MFGISLSGLPRCLWTVKAVAATLVILAASSTSSEAEARNLVRISAAVPSTPYIVGADRGGSVQKRLEDVYALRVTQRRVEIRGSTCLSSCTMLLGLPNACVSPETVFGFHGPSRFGRPLSKQQFDQVSRIIAAHYPPEIQSWYLNKARYTLTDMHMRTGAELIALGAAKPCGQSDRPRLHAGNPQFAPGHALGTAPAATITRQPV